MANTYGSKFPTEKEVKDALKDVLYIDRLHSKKYQRGLGAGSTYVNNSDEDLWNKEGIKRNDLHKYVANRITSHNYDREYPGREDTNMLRESLAKQHKDLFGEEDPHRHLFEGDIVGQKHNLYGDTYHRQSDTDPYGAMKSDMQENINKNKKELKLTIERLESLKSAPYGSPEYHERQTLKYKIEGLRNEIAKDEGSLASFQDSENFASNDPREKFKTMMQGYQKERDPHLRALRRDRIRAHAKKYNIAFSDEEEALLSNEGENFAVVDKEKDNLWNEGKHPNHRTVIHMDANSIIPYDKSKHTMHTHQKEVIDKIKPLLEKHLKGMNYVHGPVGYDDHTIIAEPKTEEHKHQIQRLAKDLKEAYPTSTKQYAEDYLNGDTSKSLSVLQIPPHEYWDSHLGDEKHFASIDDVTFADPTPPKKEEGELATFIKDNKDKLHGKMLINAARLKFPKASHEAIRSTLKEHNVQFNDADFAENFSGTGKPVDIHDTSTSESFAGTYPKTMKHKTTGKTHKITRSMKGVNMTDDGQLFADEELEAAAESQPSSTPLPTPPPVAETAPVVPTTEKPPVLPVESTKDSSQQFAAPTTPYERSRLMRERLRKSPNPLHRERLAKIHDRMKAKAFSDDFADSYDQAFADAFSEEFANEPEFKDLVSGTPKSGSEPIPLAEAKTPTTESPAPDGTSSETTKPVDKGQLAKAISQSFSGEGEKDSYLESIDKYL